LTHHLSLYPAADFEALHQVKAASKVDPLAQIGGAERVAVDQQMLPFDVGAIDTHYSDAGFPPNAQPAAFAATEIRDAVDRQHGSQERDNLFRRAGREGSQKTVKIGVVLVHFAFHGN
jgi:hypothetical protein